MFRNVTFSYLRLPRRYVSEGYNCRQLSLKHTPQFIKLNITWHVNEKSIQISEDRGTDKSMPVQKLMEQDDREWGGSLPRE